MTEPRRFEKRRAAGELAGALIVAAAMLAAALPAAAAFAADSAPCGAADGSAAGKIEAEKAKNDEKRRAAFPDKAAEKSFLEECLGSVYQKSSPFPRFPNVPGASDIVRELCREARSALGGGLSAAPYTYGLGRVTGSNTVSPWDGAVSGDIWNALRSW